MLNDIMTSAAEQTRKRAIETGSDYAGRRLTPYALFQNYVPMEGGFMGVGILPNLVFFPVPKNKRNE
jgi:hypothetical protein